ncbi:hypothetical protein Bhyg_05908 [Pseudolycoriella hygida]|uniref:F-box domain-containing protein n=1 Tax=Pseudolycoriella hygida TaxID=35572 RepID=A0A9Q0S2B8_9DIPT|nr:hypothetical protein Bhyg_05908 [Pseudolycoriella hygida]
MATNPLNIPLICDKICTYLPTRDLVHCRQLNRHWNATAGRIIRRRGVNHFPIVRVKLSDLTPPGRHIAFLNRRIDVFKDGQPFEWIRKYEITIKLDRRVCAQISEQRINDFFENARDLTALCGAPVVSLFFYVGDRQHDKVSMSFIRILSKMDYLKSTLDELKFRIPYRLCRYISMMSPVLPNVKKVRIHLCGQSDDHFTMVENLVLRFPELKQLQLSGTNTWKLIRNSQLTRYNPNLAHLTD